MIPLTPMQTQKAAWSPKGQAKGEGKTMQLSDRTKNLFAEHFVRMMDEMPYAKIRISEICRRTGLQSRVFYYHFHDKEELAAWVFFTWYASSFQSGNPPYTEEQLLEMVTAQMSSIWEHRDFYLRCCSSKTQNSLDDYIKRFSDRVNEEILKRHLGVEELRTEDRFKIWFFSRGSQETIMLWLKGAFEATPRQYAELHLANTPPLLLEAFSNYGAAPFPEKRNEFFKSI